MSSGTPGCAACGEPTYGIVQAQARPYKKGEKKKHSSRVTYGRSATVALCADCYEEVADLLIDTVNSYRIANAEPIDR